jgi:hypothetical protein
MKVTIGQYFGGKTYLGTFDRDLIEQVAAICSELTASTCQATPTRGGLVEVWSLALLDKRDVLAIRERL